VERFSEISHFVTPKPMGLVSNRQRPHSSHTFPARRTGRSQSSQRGKPSSRALHPIAGARVRRCRCQPGEVGTAPLPAMPARRPRDAEPGRAGRPSATPPARRAVRTACAPARRTAPVWETELISLTSQRGNGSHRDVGGKANRKPTGPFHPGKQRPAWAPGAGAVALPTPPGPFPLSRPARSRAPAYLAKLARFWVTLAMRVKVRAVRSSGYSCRRLKRDGDMMAGQRNRRKREALIRRSLMSGRPRLLHSCLHEAKTSLSSLGKTLKQQKDTQGWQVQGQGVHSATQQQPNMVRVGCGARHPDPCAGTALAPC